MNQEKTQWEITIDMETTALTADAAIMQIAAVVWQRDASDPFMEAVERNVGTFFKSVDLRSCYLAGCRFDTDTQQWWQRQDKDARQSVCQGTPEPEGEVIAGLAQWIDATMKLLDARSVCLWSQGVFDISILAMACKRHNVKLPLSYTSQRDCRTVILEAARKRAQQLYLQAIAQAETLLPDGLPWPAVAVTPAAINNNPSLAYTLYKPLPAKYSEGRMPHEPLYDALRSSWNTWQALQWML